MLALASDFARQVLVVDRQVSLLAMLALVVTPVVYVRMHWLALEVHLQQVWSLDTAVLVAAQTIVKNAHTMVCAHPRAHRAREYAA